MKVAFVIEYFPPFAPGGAEWSTYYLAQNLAKMGTEIVVITPNLGAKNQEFFGKVKVRRFPFYLKLKDRNSLPGNFAYTIPLWLIWSVIFYLKYLKEENPDIIHIQGKYSVPPTILANIFLKKPIVATIRDYIVICNYGICLMTKDKACNLLEYFTRDFKKYYQIYVQRKNLATLTLNLVFAIWGRLSKNLLKFSINKVDYLTAMSEKTKQILKVNAVETPAVVIRSSFVFTKSEIAKDFKDQILFVGRLTYGKGVNLLLDSIGEVLKVYPNYKFLFAGQGPLENTLKVISEKNKNLILLGQLEHQDLFNYYKESKIVIVPSIWPEPFPRVVVEALCLGNPVVVTDEGGLPEVIKNGQWGYISKKNSRDLAKTIVKAIKNNRILRNNIRRDMVLIKNKFGSEVTTAHIKLYRHLLK